MARSGYPRIRFDLRAACELRSEISKGAPTIGARFLDGEFIFCVAQNLVDGHSRVWSSSRLSLHAKIASLQLDLFYSVCCERRFDCALCVQTIEAIMKTQGAFRFGFLGGLLLVTAALLTISIPVLDGATYGTHQVRLGPPPGNLSFETAIVKPSETGVNWVTIASGANMPVSPLPGCRGTDTRGRLNIPLNRCVSRGFSLKWIIAFAYQIPVQNIGTMITGGPDWLDSVGFEIEAKAETPATEAQLHSMFQNLLAERFNLKLHRQKKELPVLTLLVAKGGPKLNAANRDCYVKAGCGMAAPQFRGRSQSMTDLANTLSWWMRETVVDKTGLAGLYDFEVGPWRSDPAPNFQPDPNAPEVRADPESLPTIFTALQEKLGLRLKSQRAEVEILVIDSADKPK